MITKGDIIYTSKPFAYVLMNKVRGERCETCLKSSNFLKKCTQCNFVFYCDKICQKKSWPDHKLECKSIIKIRPRSPPDYLRLLARIIRKLQRGGDTEEEIIGNLRRTFASLMSHAQEIKTDEEREKIYNVTSFVLSEYLEPNELPSSEIVLEIVGKIFINTITIIDELAQVALGIYLGPSALNHSCQPNVAVVFNGPILSLRSLEDIPSFNVSKLFINYIDLMNTTRKRRKLLQDQFYFWCECPACCDIDRDQLMHSIQCTNTLCTNPIISTTGGICQACGATVTVEHINSAQKIMQNLEEKVDLISDQKKANNDVFHELEIILEEASGYLHPVNLYLFKGYDEMFDRYIRKENYEKALKFGIKTLPAFRKYACKAQIGFGLQLAKIGKIQLLLNMTKTAYASLTEADQELKFHYGDAHPVYQNFRLEIS